MSDSPTAASPTGRGPWLYNPVVDLLVGCGLLAVPLGALLFAFGASETSIVVVVAGALSVVVNGPHYASTIVRALRHDRRAKLVLLVASVVAVVVTVAAHVWPALLALLFTAYLTWSPWHYATQNHGIGLLLLARGGGPVATKSERRALKFAHVALAVSAIIAIHSGPREPFLWRLGIPFQAGVTAAIVAAVLALLVGGAVLLRLRRRGAPPAGLIASAVLLTTSAVWFSLPAALALSGSLVYAGGAAALLHCAQYLWVTSFVEGRLAFVQGRRFDGLAWAATIAALGVGLFTLAPWIVSKALGYDLIISLLILQAVVNLHHFVVDAFVWKWRDPAVAGPLFAGHERAAARREEVSNLTASVATVGVVAVLLVGFADVVQLAGTRADADDDWRQRAGVLNDSDSRLWVQQAQLAIVNNDVDGARADLSRAIQLSPYNADAQRALLRLHVVAGRDEEAWSRRAAIPAGLLDEPATDVTFADVALRTGRLDDALLLARRAIAGLPDVNTGLGIEARRILGTVLLDKKQLVEARTLLRSALDDGEMLLGGGDVVSKGELLETALALSRAHVDLKQADPALVLLQRVVEGAAATDRPRLAVEAVLLQTDIHVERDQPREALQQLQRALRIAESTKDAVDPERVARAWLDYGGLLARSDAPMRTRYTCALKARGFAEKMKAGAKQEELLKFIVQATTFVEEVMSKEELEQVRTDVAAAGTEALSLSYPEDDGTPRPEPAGSGGTIFTIPPAP